MLRILALLALAAQPVAAETWRDGTTIHYDGPLTPEDVAAIHDLLAPGVTRLRITSTGGEIGLGMDLAEIVLDHGLDVEIGDHCLSSCANYVFPAGRQKILGPHSLLGWHGGATQEMEIDDPEAAAALRDYIARMIPRETAFFHRIGVAQELTTYGQRPEFADHAGCIGWTYSRATMQALGITGIEAPAGWAPPGEYGGQCVFLIDHIEALPAP